MRVSPLIRAGYSLREAGRDIFSTLPEEVPSGSYDGRARLYDAVVGTMLYNRLLWGASTRNYRAFARYALASETGPFLDAGSGSAVFTDQAYAESQRPIILADRSIGMLGAAKKRISVAAGSGQLDRIAFIQADLFDFPFRRSSFSTVLSMGMLHLFENAGELIRELLYSVADGGRLYLTSLVADRVVGRKYLSLLHKMGEVAAPRSFQELGTLIEAATENSRVETRLEGNMAYFIVSKAV